MSEQSVNETIAKPSHPYPSNANGDPEFASVLVTLDPKFISRGDHHVVQKMVYSTQYPEETLLSLFHYYGEPELAKLPGTIEILGNGFLKPSVYVYTTKQGVMEICLGTGALRTVIERLGRGSSLLGLSGLVEQIVSPMLEQAKAARGGQIPPLFMAQLTEEAV